MDGLNSQNKAFDPIPNLNGLLENFPDNATNQRFCFLF